MKGKGKSPSLTPPIKGGGFAANCQRYNLIMNNTRVDSFRIEKDYMGEMRVPKDAYYGVQTARAIENFPISGQSSQPVFTTAIVQIKGRLRW